MEKNCNKIFPSLNRWNWQKSCSPFSTSWSIQHSPHPWLVCIQKGEKIEKQCLPWRHPFPPPWSWLVCIQKSHRHLWWGLGWRMEDCESVILNGIDNDGVFPSYCWADLFSLIFLSALVINQWHPTISPLCYELIKPYVFKNPHNINF